MFRSKRGKLTFDRPMDQPARFIRWRLIFYSSLLVLLVGAVALYLNPEWLNFIEGQPPQLKLVGAGKFVGASSSPIKLVFSDSGAGIGELTVEVRGNDHQGEAKTRSHRLFAKEGVINDGEIKIVVNPSVVGVKTGKLILTATARDRSWRSNQTVLERTFEVDLVPPKLTVLSQQHNGGIGGALFAFYSLEQFDDLNFAGVDVSGYRFSGFPVGEDNGQNLFVVVFPLSPRFVRDPDLRSVPLKLKMLAEDRAGNRSLGTLYQLIQPRNFAHQKLVMPRTFYENMVERLIPVWSRESGEPIELGQVGDLSDQQLADYFKKINEGLRQVNLAKIKELAKDTQPRALWEGEFIKPLPSKMTASYGEYRSYFLDAIVAGNSIHEGYDLAHTRSAPVQASNGGRVVFANDLGIYGEAVIIDHGLGVQTLYGHLSAITTKVGAQVKKGDVIGNTGATGLAGGDHLHFEIRVHGWAVDPKEWLDKKWLESRYYKPLSELGKEQKSQKVEP